MQRLQGILKQYWGYDRFLPLQERAMKCVLEGRDSVVVLPTGGGKSLCFQAPALAMDGLAVVVSPLISLMKDQVDTLTTCGVPAAFLNSSQSPTERREVMDRINNETVKLLYVAPERLLSDGFIDYLKQSHISFVAVDEGHCISMWGHDFRPEYRELRILKDEFPQIAIHAYTATATEHVRDDIAAELHLADPAMLVGSFDRPNLIYRVKRRHGLVSQVCEVLDRHRSQSGIIYCIRRTDVDKLCADLTREGYSVLPYHAGMSDEDRKSNQDAFISERVDTIVATVAFGMGIDKSNVRYVIHGGMPKSLEHYHQETGRAGRDGLEAECWLFYSGRDFGTWRRILRDLEPRTAEIAQEKLRAMYGFCSGINCRHKAIVNYFGQDLDEDSCDACDVCLGELDRLDDSLVTAQKIISCVLRLGERFGAGYTVQVLLGSKDKRILENRHQQLSTYGLLDEYDRRIVRDWTEQLVDQDCLEKTGEYNVLRVTDKGWRVIRGELTPTLLKPARRKKAEEIKISQTSWEGVDRGLFEHLRSVRREIANRRQVPAFIIFGDAALRDMARRRPSTVEGFLRVNGVGRKKREDFGPQFVAAIRDYCLKHSIEMDLVPSMQLTSGATEKDSASTPGRKGKALAFDFFGQGRSVDEVARQIARPRVTVFDYLLEYIERERLTRPFPWVSEAAYSRILDTTTTTGPDRNKPIAEILGDQVTLDDIRLVLACLRNQSRSEGIE